MPLYPPMVKDNLFIYHSMYFSLNFLWNHHRQHDHHLWAQCSIILQWNWLTHFNFFTFISICFLLIYLMNIDPDWYSWLFLCWCLFMAMVKYCFLQCAVYMGVINPYIDLFCSHVSWSLLASPDHLMALFFIWEPYSFLILKNKCTILIGHDDHKQIFHEFVLFKYRCYLFNLGFACSPLRFFESRAIWWRNLCCVR